MLSLFCCLTLCIYQSVVATSHEIFFPTGYGSTHFIIGQPVFKKTSHVLSRLPDTVDTILFSPDDDVCAHLLELINKEQQSIKMTIYLLTDEQIMHALINAHQRGVSVEIVVDPKHMYDRSSRVYQLCQQGICVFVFNPKYSDLAGTGLMHNKFVIFGSEQASTSAVWTGSFNFTKAAREWNQEHIVIVRGTNVLTKFTQQFERLKQRCVRYTTRMKSTQK